MVYKEEICSWFGKACGWERIDLMCKLLQQCTALELRFIGSCVEDRARKDYHGLRECELKSNDANELSKLPADIYDDRIRSLLNIYLSVLYSINTQCSHILFELITKIEAKLSSPAVKQPECNQKFAEDVLLLYTMAAYHPAFSFHQRQKLWECLSVIENLYINAIRKPPSDSGVDESDELSGTSCISIPVSNHSNTCIKHHANNATKSVHVRDIELKGSQWKADERRFEFQIQVTWSDGEVTDALRTYQDVQAFHGELLKSFPKDSGAHKQERHIPFLPQTTCPRGERNPSIDQEQMGKYIRDLSSLPDHIIQCKKMTDFFRTVTRKTTASPAHATGREDSCAPGSKVPLVKRPATSHITPSPVSPQASASQSPHKHASSPVTQSPSPQSSPLTSPPVSPRISPSQSGSSTSSRPSSPRAGLTGLTIAQWLKTLRLHKYTDSLEKYNWAEVFKLTDRDLEIIGLTAGAKKKLRSEIEQLKRKTVGLNGVSCAEPGSPSSSPVTWHTPPCSATFMSQSGNTACVKSPTFSSNASSSVESSPTCSEYSSPPLSPLSHKTQKHQPTKRASLGEIDRDENGGKREHMMPQPKQLVIPPQDQGSTVNLPPRAQAEPSNNSHSTFMPIQNSVETKPGQAPPINMHNYPPLGYPRPPGLQTQAAGDISAPNMYSPRHPVHNNPVRSPRPQATKMVHHVASTQLAVSLPVNGYGPAGDGPHVTKTSVVHMAENMATSGSSAVSNAILPTPGTVVPMGTSHPVGATSIARPSTLGMPMIVPGSMASTNVTYTIAPGTTIPPPNALDVKNVMHGLNLTSGAEVSGTYTVFHQGSSTTSSTVTYTSSGFQPSLPNSGHPPPGLPPYSVPASVVTPQAGVSQVPVGVRQSPSPAGTQNSASPAPVHIPNHGVPTPTPTTVPTPNPTPNGSTGSGCSSCGCSGHCGQAAPAPTYQYNLPHVWPPNPMIPHQNFPYGFTVTSNGLIGQNHLPGLPFSPHPVQQQPPPFNLPNGVTPEVLYNNQTNFAMVHSATGQHPHFMAPHMPFIPGIPPAHIGLDPRKLRNTTPMCHNCGQSGHRAQDCKEATMESMTRSAQYHLNLNPKSDAE